MKIRLIDSFKYVTESNRLHHLTQLQIQRKGNSTNHKPEIQQAQKMINMYPDLFFLVGLQRPRSTKKPAALLPLLLQIPYLNRQRQLMRNKPLFKLLIVEVNGFNKTVLLSVCLLL